MSSNIDKAVGIVDTARTLATPRNINRVPFDGSSDITVPLRQPLNNMCVTIGDSIAGWLNQGWLMQSFHPDSFANHLATMSHQRIRNVGIFATGGYTLAQVQSLHLPSVLAMSPSPGACIIQGGPLNSILGAVSFSAMVTTMKQMVASLLGGNVWPILMTQPPMSFGSHQAAIVQWNDWIRLYAQRNGFGLIDSAAEVTATNGSYFAAYDYGDTVHMTVAAHAATARRAIADGLADYFPPTQGMLTARSSADVTNLFSASGLNRGLFTTDTSGVGTGFTAAGTGTSSIVTPTAGQDVRGNLQRIARTTGQTGTRSHTATLTTGWSPGDVLAIAFQFDTSGFEATGIAFNMYAQNTFSTPISTPVGNVTTWIAGIFGWTTDHVDGLEYAEWTIPPTSTTFTVVQSVGAVVGTANPLFDVGELTIRNLTTGNLLL